MEAIAVSLAEAVLSGLFRSLMDFISSTHFNKFARKDKILSELKKWEKNLRKIEACLKDAEEKQTTSHSIQLWLSGLRDIAYDAEDIIDELAYELLRRQIKEHADPKARNCLPTYCLKFNPLTIKFSSKMESKIRKLTARLEEAVLTKKDLSLVENGSGRYERMKPSLRTSSSLVESRVYGREADKEAVLDMLMNGSNDEGTGDFSVACIWGMGGVGKTTLAQLVYNDMKVQSFFDFKVWVCVSEEFDVVRLTNTILQAVTMESCNLKDLNLLQISLKEKLFGKKFLIVFDDVWKADYEDWEQLCRPFISGATGSKILVTTRNEGVASMMAAYGTYHLRELTNDDCLSLFTRHALGTSDFEGQPNLKTIGEEIVKKCKGLPLAAKTLGGLLRAKENPVEWEDVAKSKIWDLPEERSGILPALRLSYHHLPFHLKRCFSYCAIFPKDYEIDKEELVQLWMAEGFLHQTKKKRMEDIGVEYFRDLLSRSFFQQSTSTSNKTRYVMHDLINDLAQFVSREICFSFEHEGDKLNDRVELFRHFSFLRHQYDASDRFEILHYMKSLRTLVAFPIHIMPWAADSFLSNNVLQELLPRLACLRVLSLSGYCIDELPHRIGDLKHLRYLNLSRTRIKSLPDSVGSLFNLQTLILHGCKNLIKLPQAMENLKYLHVLDLTGTDSLAEMPVQIGNLKKLQVLSKFIVQRVKGTGITELKGLLHLRKELSIHGLENAVETRHPKDYVLKDKQSLEKLDLQWSHEFLDHGSGEDGIPVFNMLQPHQNLKGIRVAFYGGAKFPSWFGGFSLANIEDINLSNCRNVVSLPALGRLASLKKLSIEGMNGVKRLDFEFFGDDKPFPVLEVLQFQNMLNWDYWYSPSKANKEVAEFPSLLELMIHNCPKLYQKLPRYLPSLVKLKIKGCPNVDYSVMSLPSLLDLSIEDCNKIVLRSMVDLTSLTTLRIRSLLDLTCLPNGFEQFPGALKKLTVSHCNELTSLWQKGNEQGLVPNELRCLVSLEHLLIESCPRFVSFPETVFWSALRQLRLRDIPLLKDLPCWIMRHGELTGCLLEELEIAKCPSLTSFPRGRLPPTLKMLKIEDCIHLSSLPEGLMQADSNKDTSCLKNLEISECPSLVCFPEGRLPTSLKTLKIWDRLQLEPLSERMLPDNASLEHIDISGSSTLVSLPDSLNNLTCLMELIITNCQYLKDFPEIGLSLPNLRTLEISSCGKLTSLPDQMLNLTSLQYLSVCECPSIVSFPRGGLPPNILFLEIWDCKELKEPISNWNLHTLTSLRELTIVGGQEMISFPDDKCFLPTTLVRIYLARLHNLESLSMELQNLTLLEELDVIDCPKLRSLPREGFPATLGRLGIKNCSLLEDRCSREKGEYWHLIAPIPCVEIEPADS